MNTETVTPKVKTGRKVKWPLLSLAVGESLTVPLCDGPAQKISPILSATARRNPEFRFKQKRTDGGFVITRVEAKPQEVVIAQKKTDCGHIVTKFEKCESDCAAPVAGYDSEGVPLCKECLDDLNKETAKICANPDGDTMCANCDCWKATRANCSQPLNF